MKAEFLKKIPWKNVCKVTGVATLTIASVMGAMEKDENTQKLIKKLAAKAIETMEKKS